MNQLRTFFSLLRWDIAVELRRKEATLNMCLFAGLMLFVGSYAISGDPDLQDEFGPIFYWLAIVFSGTVGLSRAFMIEKEQGALSGLLLAPVDPGVLYLAKVAATWIYVMFMSGVVLLAYVPLFDYELSGDGFGPWWRLGALGVVTALFVLGYVATGVLVAAMTTGLRGGEVILRTLLFPLMMPAIVIAFAANPRIFHKLETWEIPATWSPWVAAAALGAFAAIYLSSSFLLFGNVMEE